MLEKVMELTNEYIENIPKKERKKYGQFFTSMETARFMAGLYHIPTDLKKVSLLDAGAGSGILSCALIERLERMNHIQEIEVTCYENDINVLSLLKNNLEYCKEHSNKKIMLNIIPDNYILSQSLDFNHMIGGNREPKKYDFVIGNPPYMKISKDAPEAKAMPEVCYGAPNLYFIFASMGLFNLQDDGEMVYIIPRSWTSGAYFKKFREYFLTEGKLEHIHLFVSRNKVFDKEDVLQETIIVKVKKTQVTPDTVTITSSNSNKDFGDITSFTVPYNLVVSGKDFYVYLVTNEKEVGILERLQKFDYTLPDIGGIGSDFNFSTGKHNQLQKAIIEEFAPRFAPNSECLYVGDTIEKDLVKNVDKLMELGFEITLHDKMPDVVLYREDKDWIYFVEAVTSVGPMNPKRILEIEEMTKDVKSGKIFVTAFPDFKTYKKFSEELAWETEVWIAEMSEHMIHLNGDRFMGPR